jgi:hypothetical protein
LSISTYPTGPSHLPTQSHCSPSSVSRLVAKPNQFRRKSDRLPAYGMVPSFSILRLGEPLAHRASQPNLLLSSGTIFGDPTTSGHIYLGSVKLTSTTDASNGAEYMTALAGPDIQVYNSTFLSNANQVFDILFGDGWRSEFSRSMRFTEHRDLSRGRRVSTGCLCNWLDNRAVTEHCIFRHRIGQHFPAPNQVSQE